MLLPPPNADGYVVISVGMFTCLAATLRRNKMKGFPRNFQYSLGMAQDKILNTLNMFPIDRWINIFLCYGGQFLYIKNVKENNMNGFD